MGLFQLAAVAGKCGGYASRQCATVVVAERQLRACNCTARLNTLKAKSGMPAHVALQHVQGAVGLIGSVLLQYWRPGVTQTQ